MANRYWVGGTSTWDGTAGTKWATTSGGAGGAGAPGAGDAVFFDANSGTGTVTLGASVGCSSLDATGFTGTLALGANTLTVTSGNLKLVSGMTFTANGGLVYLQSIAGGSPTCDFAGKTFNGRVRVEGSLNSSQTLLSSLTLSGGGTANTFEVRGSSGGSYTFNTGSFNITTGQFICGGGVGTSTVVLGSSTITASSFSAATGNTISAGTSTINLSASTGSAVSFTGGGKIYNSVTMTVDSSATGNIFGSATFTNLTIQNSAGSTSNYFYLESGTTQTVTGTLTITGNNAGSRRLLLVNLSGLTQASLNPTGTRSVTNVDFRGIAVSGTALSGTSVGDAGNNSGITFTPAVTRYAVAAGAFSSTSTWSATSGGAAGASVPLPQDTLVMDSNTPAGTYTWDLQCLGQLNATPTSASTLSMSSTQSLAFASRGLTINNNVTLSNAAGRTLLWGPASASTMAVMPASGTLDGISVIGPAAATLGGDLSLSGTLEVAYGSLDSSSYNVTASRFYCHTAASQFTLSMGSGTWTATSNSIPVQFVSDGPSLSAGTSTLVLQSGGGMQLGLASRTFNNVTLQGSAATSFGDATAVTGNTLSHTGSGGIVFRSGTTYTFSNWNISGSPGSVRSVSSSSLTNHTLAKSGGGLVALQYLNLSRSTASPASTFSAYSSTDGGNNVNWTIYANDPRKRGNLFFGSNF